MAARVRRAAPWLACLVGLTSVAHAYVPRSAGPRIAADTLTALPAAQLTKPLRVQPHLRFGAATPSPAWTQFVAQSGGHWEVAWDGATGVANRIWGSGISAPGSVANADIAERVSRQFLADHLALLAPGSMVSDFELVSNRVDDGMRVVGFRQRANGLRVVGGQVSFRFKADRLFVIGSEALPYVSVATPRSRLAPALLHDVAVGTLRSAVMLPTAPVTPLGEEVVLPLIADDGVLGYRIARTATIDGGVDGRYLGYVDVASGTTLAVRQLNSYAAGTVSFWTVDRYPARPRIARPAPRAHLMVAGASQTSTMGGGVSWTPDEPTTVHTSVDGDLVTVVNKWDGDGDGMPDATTSADIGIAPGDNLVWDASATDLEDAQLNTYMAVNIAKEFVRNNIDAQMQTLDDQIVANVNLNQNCNAFYDGKVNFFHASTQCENTGRILDVIYHEFGHHVHSMEIIPAVGDFDGAMSEGAADFLAASITGDSGMGRGFYYTDVPLREIDPPDREAVWPDDVGEIHTTGEIYSGALWDLRKQLIADLGEAQAIPLVLRIFRGTLRRSVNIPTSVIEALAEDDDDGNLDNGTPHECQIRSAFAAHGLRPTTGTIVAPGQLDANALAVGVHIELHNISDRCNADNVTSVRLEWFSLTGTPPKGSVDAIPAGPHTYFAQLPLAPQGSVFYRARILFNEGFLILADNLADPWYQVYTGPVVKLYCTDFETTDPFSDGWTAGTDMSDTTDWQWGTPTAGASDPHAAFSGSKIVALKLDGDYQPKQHTWLKAPPINVGQYSDVHLQYRRWLAVEDGHFDQAQIMANGKQAWINFTADKGDASSTHHIDKEWRFQDLPLSGYFSGHTVQVGWELTSDEGLNLGGWQLDDVCLVANPNSVCGDGVKSPTEQCDKGPDNKDAPNVCHTDCHLPTCGDNLVDTGEECDEGSAGTTTCSDKCKIIEAKDGGCCSASGGEATSLTLAGLVGMLLFRRRRRR